MMAAKMNTVKLYFFMIMTQLIGIAELKYHLKHKFFFFDDSIILYLDRNPQIIEFKIGESSSNRSSK